LTSESCDTAATFICSAHTRTAAVTSYRDLEGVARELGSQISEQQRFAAYSPEDKSKVINHQRTDILHSVLAFMRDRCVQLFSRFNENNRVNELVVAIFINRYYYHKSQQPCEI